MARIVSLPFHGPGRGVADSSDFTFALEQKKTYTFGREKSCDIRFDDKAVKPKAGVLEVDDWDPTEVCSISTLASADKLTSLAF
jgi:hypothetical protein